MRNKSMLRGAWINVKGSVERSLLPWAIFLFFRWNRPWKSEDHRCFLLKCQRKDTKKKRKNTASFVATLGAGVPRPRSTVKLFMPVSAVEKRPFSQFFLGFGVSFVRKILSWPAMPVSNKKQEFEQRKRIKLFDDFWVRAYRFDFTLRRRSRARSM